MSPRDAILQAVRANRPAGDHPLPEVPQFLREGEDLRAAFEPAFKSMGGRLVDLQPGEDPPAAARRVLADAKPVCSRVLEIDGDYDLAAARRPADLADVDFAVLRARLGVAETGSVLFTEAEFGVNALGYLAQHLLVLLDPADLSRQPPPRLCGHGLPRGQLCGVPHRPVRHGGHRGRPDPRRPGRTLPEPAVLAALSAGADTFRAFILKHRGRAFALRKQ